VGDNRAIGVFDSGLGGLTVVKELLRVLPNESIVYFGDTGRVPYGTRSRDTIRKYALQDEKFLINKNVKLIIAACGTVSSVAADTANLIPVPFFEVVSNSVKDAIKKTKNKIIGVIGTAATIKSGQHEKQIKELLPDATVVSQSCTLFVPLVEEGLYSQDDVVVLEIVRRYLEPIINSKADTLILGCTHYPVLADAIKRIVGNEVTLINAGTATAYSVKDYISKNDMLNDSNSSPLYDFFVSDKPDSFRSQASILLGGEINEQNVKQVDLSNLW